MSHVAVVGSGYMGGGIAQLLALAGDQVRIADASLEIATASRERLIAEAAAFAADGLFPSNADAVIRDGVTAHELEDAVAGATFIEEAVPERIDIKHDILRRIGAAAPADAVIGSNTSTISIGTLAEVVERPERFLGVHYSNPSPFIPGVEIIPHAGTTQETVDAAVAIARSTGKQTAIVADRTGFVLNRLQYALFIEANRVLEEGVATAEDIDTIVRTTFGFRLPFFGPFAIADMAGLDTYGMGLPSVNEAYPGRFETPQALADLVAAGHYGTKTGAGYLKVPAERIPELVAYRNRAYVAMAKLLAELGPAPID